MVAAHDSKSCLERGVSSSLTPGTKNNEKNANAFCECIFMSGMGLEKRRPRSRLFCKAKQTQVELGEEALSKGEA